MAFEGELNGTEGTTCMDCGAKLPLKICMSAAGYYLGYECLCCGPYSRESGYFRSREDAEKELESLQRGEGSDSLRDTDYHPGPLEVTFLGGDHGE